MVTMVETLIGTMVGNMGVTMVETISKTYMGNKWPHLYFMVNLVKHRNCIK